METNICCHHCRISQRRRPSMEYVKCFLCRQRYCASCLNNPERLDIGVNTAQEYGWVCPCCTSECCCSYHECHTDHVHCYTYRRTISRHGEQEHKWVKPKLVQYNAAQSYTPYQAEAVSGLDDLLRRLLAIQRETFNGSNARIRSRQADHGLRTDGDNSGFRLKRDHVEDLFAQRKQRRLT